MKTVQFRRYRITDGYYESFVAGWDANFPTLRPEAGFAIEFAYGIPETNEFVWAVSVNGDRAEFDRLFEIYMSSEARAAVFERFPDRLDETFVSFVEITADAAGPAYPAVAR